MTSGARQPKATKPRARANVEVLLLAAGASTRMRGPDKLLEDINGDPLLRHCARVALGAKVARVNVVLPPNHKPRLAALHGLNITTVDSPHWQDGISASIRAGLAATAPDCKAVIIALADMPDVTADHLNRLLAAFDPQRGPEICRAVSENGTPGHPVLFGRRFFAALAALSGDTGAREVLRGAPKFVTEVATRGQGALTDLDTPQDWAKWRRP